MGHIAARLSLHFTRPQSQLPLPVLLLLGCLCTALCFPLAALDEPLPAYEKGYYDWTGNEWGLQHHFQIMTGYDDNPLRANYSARPLPDFHLRGDYGLVLGRYLDRTRFVRVAYDAQAFAWARYSDLNTVDHTLTAQLNYFDPGIAVTGDGWFVKPRLFGFIRKAPEDFIAGAAPRRLHVDLNLPGGWIAGRHRLELAPLWRQDRYLDGGFAVLDRRDMGAYAEYARDNDTADAATYLRYSYRAIDFRRDDLFNNFSVHNLRAGWRLEQENLGCDLGLDFALFNRRTNRATDGTPQSQLNLSPFVLVRWRIIPETTRLNFSLQRFFAADTAVSATALTVADFRLAHVVAPDLIEVGVLSKLQVSHRLSAGSATLFELQADANLRVEKGDWPPITVVLAVGLNVNRDDLSGNSYLARTAQLGFRAVF